MSERPKFFYGWWIVAVSAIGARRVILLSSVIFALLLLSSHLLSPKLWDFYVFYGLLGFVGSGPAPIPLCQGHLALVRPAPRLGPGTYHVWNRLWRDPDARSGPETHCDARLAFNLHGHWAACPGGFRTCRRVFSERISRGDGAATGWRDRCTTGC
jgi:hypothetical protein